MTNHSDDNGEWARIEFPEITREVTHAFALASGDANPIHFDDAAARAAGFPAPFAQGMLITAWLGRVLGACAKPETILSFTTRFLAPVPLGTRLTGIATARAGEPGTLALRLSAVDITGKSYAEGEALISATPDSRPENS